MKQDKIAIISTGNGGQSLAALFSYYDANVSLYAREQERVDMFEDNIFHISGVVDADVKVNLISCNMQEVIKDAELIMVTTPSHYCKVIAREIAPYLKENQIIVLNPGRSFGTYEFLHHLRLNGLNTRVILAEADSFVLTCRSEKPGYVHIYHIKHNLRIAAHRSSDTDTVVSFLTKYFPAIKKANNVFETAFLNIGMIFHPVPVLTNFAKIENKEVFKYYHGAITPATADLLERLDAERIAIADKMGVYTIGVKEWLLQQYGSNGTTLYEAIQNTEAYEEILSPTTLDTRYIHEDIRTGCVPMSYIAKMIGVATPTMDAVISWASALYNLNFYEIGRNDKDLNLEEILEDIKLLNKKQ